MKMTTEHTIDLIDGFTIQFNTNKIWLHAKVSPKTNLKRGSNTVTRY